MIRDVGKAAKANANEMANLEFALAMINAYKTASNTYELMSKVLPPPAPRILSIIDFAAQAANANAIRKQSIGQAEEGGFIGGRRHSQGGTIIEAEQGEYILNRDAVESIGVNNLNRMNQGGGAQIVINNPIISSQYVEEELPDLIAEAVRKGADFGLS